MNSLKTNSENFEKHLQEVMKKLKTLPASPKTDEVSVPLYLHKNFLVRSIFVERFKTAYNMTQFADNTVLDFGCGSGIFLESISHEIKKGIGVDLDIQIAKKIVTSENISLIQTNQLNNLLQFSKIDVITSFDVLEHVEDLKSLLQRFTKVLSHEGIIIISGPTENFFYKIARKFANIGINGNLKGKEEHIRDILDIKKTILDSGFDIQKEKNLWNLFNVISFKIKN